MRGKFLMGLPAKGSLLLELFGSVLFNPNQSNFRHNNNYSS